jgi:hypothetical protein
VWRGAGNWRIIQMAVPPACLVWFSPRQRPQLAADSSLYRWLYIQSGSRLLLYVYGLVWIQSNGMTCVQDGGIVSLHFLTRSLCEKLRANAKNLKQTKQTMCKTYTHSWCSRWLTSRYIDQSEYTLHNLSLIYIPFARIWRNNRQ